MTTAYIIFLMNFLKPMCLHWLPVALQIHRCRPLCITKCQIINHNNEIKIKIRYSRTDICRFIDLQYIQVRYKTYTHPQTLKS